MRRTSKDLKKNKCNKSAYSIEYRKLRLLKEIIEFEHPSFGYAHFLPRTRTQTWLYFVIREMIVVSEVELGLVEFVLGCRLRLLVYHSHGELVIARLLAKHYCFLLLVAFIFIRLKLNHFS